jgi:hypothetical protein
VHVAGLSADIGLIRFHDAAHFLEGALLHGEPNALQHEPTSFLADAKGAANLVRANAVLSVGN